jgi:integrase
MADVFRPRIRGRRSTYYYGKVRDPRTKAWSKVSLGVTDKQVAREKLRDLQRRAERVAAGLVVPLAERPVSHLLAAFVRDLELQGRSESYRVQTECEIIKVALHCVGRPLTGPIDRKRLAEFRARLDHATLDALTPDRVDEFLAALPAATAARTRNGYRTSVVGLFSFLVRKRRIPYNPILCVTRHKGEQKHVRRALTAEQLQALVTAARARPLAASLVIRRGARKGRPEAAVSSELRQRRERDGLHRALVYLTAFYTGLRRGELRALCVKHLDLDGPVPHVRLPGAWTKNGRDAVLPVGPDLAGWLRTWVGEKGSEERVFRIPAYDELLKALKKDLAFAGIPYRDDHGRVFDFHSLRKSLGTHLRLAKVDPAVSQLFLRHGDTRRRKCDSPHAARSGRAGASDRSRWAGHSAAAGRCETM